MTKRASTSAKDARLAAFIAYHTNRQKEQIRTEIMEAKPGTIAATVTERTPLRWRAVREMIEAGEVIVLSETNGPTRRGPPAANGKRRVRREVRVTLAGWDPITREFTDDERI